MKDRIEEYTKHYYTGNHLSSTQLVTDGTGDVVQQVEYAPFGEVVNEYNIDWSSGQVPDFKFNAKELDEESGMYYFEARYQSPPVFISRDVMFEKYPTLSPYAYCANNPVKYIDPDGNAHTIPILLWKATGYIMEKLGTNNNVKTIGYAMNHPINAYQVKYNYNIAATNFQVNIGKAIGESANKDGSPQNAIRHTLWQAMMASNLGAKHATRVGAAHEDNNAVDITQRTFSSLLEADKVVDLLNNQIGREIGKKNKGATNKELAGEVMKEYRDNGLWTASENKNGTVSIQKSRITKDQYKAALEEINKKGENGLNQ
ncbi:MAG: RHS repeat-associated core domain-containing protein [Bacteroidales bacterium]|jgi:RHS repeat-associated protein|nr:RHS repeat-associated core domain-containing protein [Bacteroidales bacterium]